MSLKVFNRLVSIVASFSILANAISAPLAIYAQEETPAPEESALPSFSPEPTPTQEPEITPEPTPTQEPEVTPEPSPSTLPEETQEPESTPLPEETATPTPGAEPTSVPAADEPEEDGTLNVVLLENTEASSIDKYDLEYQTEGSATLSTDKADYAPTDTVLITGSGFLPSESYTLEITSETGNFKFSDTVTSDESGGLFYAYQLDGTYRPNYLVQAFDFEGNVIAEVTFTDDSPLGINVLETFPNLSNWDISNASIANGTGEDSPYDGNFAKIGKNGWICRTIDASGYKNLQLQYYWKGDNDAENDDYGVVEYKTSGTCSGGGWTNIRNNRLNDTTWGQRTENLSSSLNNTTFKIRFRTNSSQTNEFFRVDNVEVKGIQAGYSAVLSSPTPPTSSSSFTWTVSGSKPTNPEEISHFDITGCWTGNQISSVVVPAGLTYETGAVAGHGGHISGNSGMVTVEGLNDSKLPFNVTINFNTSFASDGTASAFVKVGGGANTGFPYTVGGPNCQPQTGGLEVTKVVEWNGVTPDTNKSFNICIENSSGSWTDCKDVGYNGGTLSWTDLTPGDYTVTETDPGGNWIVTGSGQVVVVTAGSTSQAEVVNEINPVVVKGYKVMCDAEQYLPNWGNNGAQIGAGTAQDWVNQSDGHCWLDDQWMFQWSPAGGGSFGAFQTDTSILGSPWTMFTTATPAVIGDMSNLGGRIEVREIFSGDGLVGFSNDPGGVGNSVSAEIYCTGDVFNYDNWEWINNPQYGQTYHCVAFNARQTGSIEVTKVVNWDEAVQDTSKTFDICISGPSFPGGNCKESDYDGEVLTWNNLLPGSYNVSETDPGSQWVVGGTGSVSVVADTTATKTITNTINPVRIQAWKVVCDAEQYLPNWGLNSNGAPSQINSSTAANYVSSINAQYEKEVCRLVGDWDFEWDYDGSAVKRSGEWVGSGGATWNNFNVGAAAEAKIYDLKGTSKIWVREVLPDSSWLPFSYPPLPSPGSDFSAELYCHTDVFKYDNYESVDNPRYGGIYYCVAFNALNYGSVTIHKFEDLNKNGSFDNGEPTLDGWDFTLGGETKTTQGGVVFFDDLIPGTYGLTENVPSGWVQTNIYCENEQFSIDNSNERSVTVTSGENTNCYAGNFELGSIQGRKYDDMNASGVRDPGELWLSGWEINLYDSDWEFVDSTTTVGVLGIYRFEDLDLDTYYTCEVVKPGWVQTGPISGGNRVANQSPNSEDEGPVCWRSVFTMSGQSRTGRQFGNALLGDIQGFKWHDVDGNGSWDGEEGGIEGWEIQLWDGDLLLDTIFTDEDGFYLFENVIPGDYSVCEVMNSNYKRTYPYGSDCQSVTLNPGDSESRDFGNQWIILGLELTKENSVVGSIISYTLVVTNTGNQVLENVNITDALPGGFDYIPGTSELDGSSISDPTSVGGAWRWEIGTLGFGTEEARTLTYKAQINVDTPGEYTNIAVATGVFILSYEIENGQNDLLSDIGPFTVYADEILVESEPATSGVESNVAESSTLIAQVLSYGGDIAPQVLGAATELPATGNRTGFLYLAVVVLLAGVGVKTYGYLTLGREKRRKYAKN